jgi:hypothetical protein
MQTNIRIILMVTIAGIGALMFGSSLATAAFAQWGSGTSQSIQQTNKCAYATCSNIGTNVAGGGAGSTSQSIDQTNNCIAAKCSNTATNIAGFKWW